MPSGAEHRFYNFRVFVAIWFMTLCAAIIMKNPLIITLNYGFIWATIFQHPDLDQAESQIRNDFEGWWKLIWYPYGKLFSHRNPLTHWPGISTIGRQIYFSPIVFLINVPYLNIEGLKDENIWQFIQNVWYKAYFLRCYWHYYFIIGAVIADTIHFVMDQVKSDIKKESKK